VRLRFHFNKVDFGGPAWIINASKSTEGMKAQIDVQAWMLAVWASICSLSARKSHFMASVLFPARLLIAEEIRTMENSCERYRTAFVGAKSATALRRAT
jgi:hypothetical protein